MEGNAAWFVYFIVVLFVIYSQLYSPALLVQHENLYWLTEIIDKTEYWLIKMAHLTIQHSQTFLHD